MSQIAAIVKNKWGTLPKESSESFTGRNVLVTGVTFGGLGYAAAVKFAKLGATKVIITARDEVKGKTSKSKLEAELGQSGQFEAWELDMNSYDSIVKFSQRAVNELQHLDVVILNVGVFATTHRTSQYGWEEDIQVNTLSTILLGILLLPKLKDSKAHTGKIPVLQFVNSGLHTTVEVSAEIRSSPSILTAYNNPKHYSVQGQYAYSKLLQRLATNHMAAATPSNQVIITSVCPGMVISNITRDINFPGVSIVIAVVQAMLFRTADQGANTYVSGAAQNEELHGKFWTNDVIQPDGRKIKGEENKTLVMRVWDEIVGELAKHVPEVSELFACCS
jgi:NAD(P)-dependent dehydrogenase (short-subunit alcohol dehydrogenase family)